jgi:hypothetical protein
MKSNSFFSSSQPIEIMLDGMMKKERKIIEFLFYLKLKIIFFD